MQTFFPVPNCEDTAKILDYRRLGKQRIETKQIIDTLEGRSNGWKNHPAVKMWIGHTEFLKYYYNCMIYEWKGRGYKNTMPFLHINHKLWTNPPWYGNNAFHASHRSALLYKNYDFYKQFNWIEKPELKYVWPT